MFKERSRVTTRKSSAFRDCGAKSVGLDQIGHRADFEQKDNIITLNIKTNVYR